MKVCVFHRRLGQPLGARLAQLLPDDEVSIVEDVAHDPPGLDQVEVLIANSIPPGLLARAPKLRLLQLTSSGVDQVAAGLPGPSLGVAHAADVPARAVAEFAMMGLLALAKGAPALVRNADARRWQLPDARLVAGSTLVLVGLGHIGVQIARRAAAFELKVHAVTRRGAPSAEVLSVSTADRLVALARGADHLIIAVPGTASTKGVVSREVIAALPSHATVINVGRASVLDGAAVIDALRAGRLRAALLDVHDPEPLPPEHPAWNVPGLWVSPHGAFVFPEEASHLATLAAENVERLRSGRPLRNGALGFD